MDQETDRSGVPVEGEVEGQPSLIPPGEFDSETGVQSI